MTSEVSADASMFACVKESMNSAWTSTSEFVAPVTAKVSELCQKTGLNSVGDGAYSFGEKTVSFCKENSFPITVAAGALTSIGALYAAYKMDRLPECIQSRLPAN